MSNGTTKDLKNVDVTIDTTKLPDDLHFEAPTMTPPQNKFEVVGGNNGGGYEFKANNSVDGIFVLRLFKRDEFFELEQKYLGGSDIYLYVKDRNTQQAYADGSTKILNIGEYTLGAPDAVEVTIALPKFLRQ